MGGVPVSVLLAGEAGIGKTRLVEEFTAQAYAQGARILTGACIDLGDTALPYGALIDALRGVPPETYDELSPELLRTLAALVPELAPEGVAVEGGQTGLFGAVLRVIEHLPWCPVQPLDLGNEFSVGEIMNLWISFG